MTKAAQPQDEWQFLPKDEWDEPTRTVAEVAAVHVGRDVRPPAEDPGRSDVRLGDDGTDADRDYFDDEQPEGTAPLVPGDDTEPDLETILESQHYAFEPESPED